MDRQAAQVGVVARTMALLKQLDWGYMLPGVILLGCTLFGLTAAVNTSSGWFVAKGRAYYGTLAYYSSSPTTTPLSGSIRAAGLGALLLTGVGLVFCLAATVLAVVLGIGWHGHRSFGSCTAAWLTAMLAGLFYTAGWTEYLGVMYSDWNEVLPVLNQPQADWALIMVATASSLSFMCCALLLWAFVGRSVERNEYHDPLESTDLIHDIQTAVDPDDLADVR